MGQRLSTLPIFTFYGLLLPMLELDSERPFHRTTIPFRNSIAACKENDHLNNSEHGSAIKKYNAIGKSSSLQ
jgi:hypothetical protein